MYETRHTITLLSCCVAAPGLFMRTIPSGSSSALNETSALLSDIHGSIAPSRFAHQHNQSIPAALQAIERIDSFNELSEPTPVAPVQSAGKAEQCDEPAVLYLSTGDYLLFNDPNDDSCETLEGLALEVAGNAGSQQFVFASGTPMDIIIASINTFTTETGVSGAVADANEERIELRSVEQGEQQFVSVTMLDADQACFAIVCSDPTAWPCHFSAVDFGVSSRPGDVTCDQQVDIADLMFVLSNWGACPSPPDSCSGDANLDGVVNVSDLLLVLGYWSR